MIRSGVVLKVNSSIYPNELWIIYSLGFCFSHTPWFHIAIHPHQKVYLSFALRHPCMSPFLPLSYDILSKEIQSPYNSSPTLLHNSIWSHPTQFTLIPIQTNFPPTGRTQCNDHLDQITSELSFFLWLLLFLFLFLFFILIAKSRRNQWPSRWTDNKYPELSWAKVWAYSEGIQTGFLF